MYLVAFIRMLFQEEGFSGIQKFKFELSTLLFQIAAMLAAYLWLQQTGLLVVIRFVICPWGG